MDANIVNRYFSPAPPYRLPTYAGTTFATVRPLYSVGVHLSVSTP